MSGRLKSLKRPYSTSLIFTSNRDIETQRPWFPVPVNQLHSNENGRYGDPLSWKIYQIKKHKPRYSLNLRQERTSICVFKNYLQWKVSEGYRLGTLKRDDSQSDISR